MKAKESGFADQFKNIVSNVYTVVKTAPSSDTEIQAISGATITSKAMTGAVNAGFEYYNSLVGGGAE
jgi:electron transport complex protein RnfG